MKPAETKVCIHCGLRKALIEFNWKSRQKNQPMSYCKACQSIYNRSHYEKNKGKYIEKSAKRTASIKNERMRYLISFLRQHPCVDCGETDVIVLEFDHIGDKQFTITTRLADRNWEDVLAEIQKCEVVCRNCHTRRTARRRGSLRYLMSRAGDR